ncbi:MAG: nitroreductase [Caulobacterales bacterium]|nr:nitroreductase [Caulobacterales bacterium]
MNVVDALRARTSIRAFLDTPVERETVERLLEAARWAPSGGNLQPWKVIVVAGEAKDAVSDLALAAVDGGQASEDEEFPIYPSGLVEPYRSRRYKVGEDMYALLGIPREDKLQRLVWLRNNYLFFGAPVGLFFVIDRFMGRGQWAHLGMFMQSLALAAMEEGLATCMQEAWARMRRTLHGHFQLDPEEALYCGMALGAPDPAAPVNGLRSERIAVDEFTRFAGF